MNIYIVAIIDQIFENLKCLAYQLVLYYIIFYNIMLYYNTIYIYFDSFLEEINIILIINTIIYI